MLVLGAGTLLSERITRQSLLLFHEGLVLVRQSSDGVSFPVRDDLTPDVDFVEIHADGPRASIGRLRAEPCDPRLLLRPVRSLFGEITSASVLYAGRARQLLEWRIAHRLCGACGVSTELSESTELRCPRCGRSFYPRVSPAVIFRVDRDDRILLARAPGRPEGWFSTLAGFVEPGESLEEAVAREAEEEVGIRVTDLRYFGSQPWPFPDALMLGFTARYLDGDIRCQPGEIEEAGWFGLDDMPAVPASFSIARELIEDFVRSRGGDPEALRTWRR